MSVVDSGLVLSGAKLLVMERVSSEVTELVMGWVMELGMELVMERVSSEVTELVMGWVTGQVKALASFG